MTNRIQLLIDKYEPKKISDMFDKINITKYENNIKNNINDYDNDELQKLLFNWNYSYNPYKCFFHKKIMYDLKKISDGDDIPHIIFYGCPGTGKKTIIKLFLEMIFGSNVRDINDFEYDVQGSNQKTKKNKKKIIKQSEHHIIIEPNSNNFDKYLIQYVVKEYAKTKPLCIYEKNVDFKVVQINNLDNLSFYAQTSLRRTIEKFSKNCKFIMWCNSLSKIIEPLKSRCLCIHVPNQLEEDLKNWILNISMLEKINIKNNIINEIVNSTNGNLREILLKLDLYKFSNYKTIYHTCDNDIICLANQIINKDSMQKIKDNIYKIYVTNLHPTLLINKLMDIFFSKIKNTDIEKASKLMDIASKYEHRSLSCRRATIHIEAFVTNIMAIL
jgi:replication factor C subunit 3/5